VTLPYSVASVTIRPLCAGLLTHRTRLAGKEDQRRLLSPSSLARVFSALAGVLL